MKNKSNLIPISFLAMEKPRIRRGEGQLYTIPPSGHLIHLNIGENIVTNVYKNIFIHCPVKGKLDKTLICFLEYMFDFVKLF